MANRIDKVVSGRVSGRASTKDGVSNKNGKPYTRITFRVTEDEELRERLSDGHEYNASDEWPFSIITTGTLNEEMSTLVAKVTDLEIGDTVEVDISVRPSHYGINARVLDIRNNG